MELKPCPFCGGEADLGVEFYDVDCGDKDYEGFVYCKKCGATTANVKIPDDCIDADGEPDYDSYAFYPVALLWNNRQSQTNQANATFATNDSNC